MLPPGRHGWLSVTVSNGKADDVPRPIVPGSAGTRSAVLGPMIIELVQPVSKVGGVLRRVYFDVGTFDIDKIKKEGDDLDEFIRQDLLSPYNVRVALESGLLPVRGEARASAT